MEEKIALFWHQLFATGNSKVDNPPELTQQIKMFRQHGLGRFPDLLIELAKNPAMIYWLDNNGNHRVELLTRTGAGSFWNCSPWALATTLRTTSRKRPGPSPAGPSRQRFPRNPLGRFYWNFEYRPEDHDDGEKTFLGHEGNLDGDDIIQIVVRQPATARFLARHLYNFFVADEPQVPSWNITPPRDAEAIDTLVQAYEDSNFDIRTVLRVLFTSDFFKEAQFEHVKSPAELVVSTARLAGSYNKPRPGFPALAFECAYQGQELLNPPSVESWHTGSEWIDGGSLVRRVNFAANIMGNTSLPGIKSIVDGLRERNAATAADFVETCLELVGPIEVSEITRRELIEQAEEGGDLRWDSDENARESEQRIGVMLALIAASRDFQFA